MKDNKKLPLTSPLRYGEGCAYINSLHLVNIVRADSFVFQNRQNAKSETVGGNYKKKKQH